jgi:hypothetical protein
VNIFTHQKMVGIDPKLAQAVADGECDGSFHPFVLEQTKADAREWLATGGYVRRWSWRRSYTIWQARFDVFNWQRVDKIAERVMCVGFALVVTWASFEVARAIADRGLEFLISGGAR